MKINILRVKITVILVVLIIFEGYSKNKSHNNSVDYTKYVNPFVGTAENGHCFPNACVPFGQIQVGPETGNNAWKYCAGYQYDDLIINGFSQNRLNGTGGTDLGDLLMQPFSGEIVNNDFTGKFDKKMEKAKPGYYSVFLSNFGVKAEMTATKHVALYKYTYSNNTKGNLMIDFQSGMTGDTIRFNKHVLNSEIIFEDNYTISGRALVSSWLQNRSYYFVIKFNKPFDNKNKLPRRNALEKADRYTFDFNLNKDEKLMIKLSISANSIEGAKKNIDSELNDWNFDRTCKRANESWNNCLSKVDIVGNNDKKTMFYTSMYRMFIQPNVISDSGQKPFYSTLSLWDTYRAAHPLYTIIAPQMVDGFVNSMLQQHDKQGFLPIWALWGDETYCMIGNHAVPVIVDAFLKGFKGFDAERAYQAVKKSLTENHKNSEWDVYTKYGYYPYDIVNVESVSRTLESVYDDYCAAQFAKTLGKTEDYEYFTKRSNFYKNLFDPSTKLMRPKGSNGQWKTPFDRFALSHADTSGGDYTEGNAWQYTWHVQHDIPGLIKLMGGQEYFINKLDSLFKFEQMQTGTGFVSDVTGLIGQYAHGNEPSHHVAYLYALAGKPWRTQELVNKICKTKYINTVDGLCGNDDCGQMSAWYIFSCMGFYPVNPCGGEYVIGAPQLEKSTINLSGGKKFIVETINFSSTNIYVQSIELNGVEYTKNSILHQDIMKGGVLRFTMGPIPKKQN